MKRMIWAMTALVTATPAMAEISASSDTGFVVNHQVVIAAPPADVWATLRAPARWWSAEHSWSGDAANFWMDAQATGCFCEKLPATADRPMGSVQHARILYADPHKLLRLDGAFGPLQGEALNATLTITLTPEADGTRVAFDYVVGGYMRFATAQIAPAVDAVLGQQLAGLKTAAETTQATP